MRSLALALLLFVSACEQPDHSSIEGVFLQVEGSEAPEPYQTLRTVAYERLRKDGPAAALPAFHTAYKAPGAALVSWELLPVIARLTLHAGDKATAATHVRTARLAQRLSLGEVVCRGPSEGLFVQDGATLTAAFQPSDLGSALLVSTTMCATQDVYPRRARNAADASFEQRLAAVETLLSGASEAPSPTP